MTSLVVALGLVLQWPLDYALLVIEDDRADAAPLVEALSDTATRQQAIRAIGRFERVELAPHLTPFLSADEPALRIEAANALAQMKAPGSGIDDRIAIEQNPAVLAALYEALGRVPDADGDVLVAGLEKPEPVRYGAVKGLEHVLRTGARAPSARARYALRRVVRESTGTGTRQLALLALARDTETDRGLLELAFRDADPRVRRLAIRGLAEWRDDPSAMVRYASLRAAPSCQNAAAALRDESAHVVLLAIDTLGNGCDPTPLLGLVKSTSWRRSSRALVSLAKVDRGRASKELPRFVEHDVWQARVYAAKAAKILDAGDALETLRNDPHPNVVAEALTTPEHAVAALGSNDYGLLMSALDLLEDSGLGRAELTSALERVTSQKRATSRDPRRLMIERLSELGVTSALSSLRSDFDPFIAELAAELVSAEPETTRFAPGPRPAERFLLDLDGATARIEMKEAGPFTLELLPREAPMTVAQFAKLADAGYYDGLTFHRIVPNFVIQGGSPGANEFMGTAEYIRDEVGLLSHERGTVGISTRGRDTGDSQIFVNLIDNYRLDHNYTVFARVVEGMENVDRVQEGDVMTRVRILRQ